MGHPTVLWYRNRNSLLLSPARIKQTFFQWWDHLITWPTCPVTQKKTKKTFLLKRSLSLSLHLLNRPGVQFFFLLLMCSTPKKWWPLWPKAFGLPGPPGWDRHHKPLDSTRRHGGPPAATWATSPSAPGTPRNQNRAVVELGKTVSEMQKLGWDVVLMLFGVVKNWCVFFGGTTPGAGRPLFDAPKGCYVEGFDGGAFSCPRPADSPGSTSSSWVPWFYHMGPSISKWQVTLLCVYITDLLVHFHNSPKWTFGLPLLGSCYNKSRSPDNVLAGHHALQVMNSN